MLDDMFRGYQGVRTASALTNAIKRVTVTPRSCVIISRSRAQSSWTQQSEVEAENLDTKPRWSISPRTQKTRPGSNWTYDKELFAFAHRIGYELSDLPKLQIALTHHTGLWSRSKEEGRGELSSKESNGRLSFLGKALVQYYVAEYLLTTYPNMQVDSLADLQAFLMNTEALVKLADYIGITDLIRCQRRLDDLRMQRIISRAVFATVACLQVDQGPSAARKFVHELITSKMAGVDLHEVIKLQHPRLMLKNILVSQGLPNAESRLLKETGRATHFPTFVVGVYSGERLLGEGCGTSLKRAEREAVVAALHEHFSTQLASSAFPYNNYERESDISFFEPSSESENSAIE